MCGIAGLIQGSALSYGPERTHVALESLLHRGPDDVGVWSAEVGRSSVTLGQTRLAVIDLSLGGHQPMSSADGRYVLVFNGEIYNYRELRAQLQRHGCVFRTVSDTEVLLHAWVTWGEQCLKTLIGMFAFAILDTLEGTLTCVRDAFGIKPLYFHSTASTFAFASEVPAIEDLVGRRLGVDESSMLAYLALGAYDMGEATFFCGVSRLEAGHILHLKVGEHALMPEIDRWWWPSIAENPVDFPSAVEMVRETFLESVRLHLRSDVPLGVALSGGVDSSSIACAVRYIEPDMPIKTFSFVARGSSVDEEPWVDQVNSFIGAEPHKVVVSPEDLGSDLDEMIRAQGEPFGDTSIYAQYRVYQACREAGVTVMLDGQGADELFAGYFGYPSARIRSMLSRKDLVGAVRLMRAWSRYPGRSRSLAFHHLGSALSPGSLRPWARRLVGQGVASELFEPGALDTLAGLETLRKWNDRPRSGDRALAAELRFALTEGPMSRLLRNGDRNSMHWSVESRVPFLTLSVAELALSLPESYLLSPIGETKSVLRAALSGIAPKSVLYRRDKVGFETPERQWLKAVETRHGEWLDGLEMIPGLDVERARTYVRESVNRRGVSLAQTWRLVNAARWTQIFGAHS